MSKFGLARAGLALGVVLLTSPAWSKDYKSGELETTNRYGFGAFEARIHAAKGPGVISTFFLWKPGSDQAPSIPWHEIDFEMGQASGDYQTQVMTPGTSPPLYRTEHAVAHNLASRPWEAYYTYRMEWTPTYIAFYVDGNEVRRETDPVEFASMFMTDSNGDTPVSERMEVRTGVWPGATTFFGWSGVFDGSTVPTGHFVDYMKIWKYTPNQANKFATVLMDEQFNTVNYSNFYPANWTFDPSGSDYVQNNIGAINGRLVVALTTNAGQGILPSPPADVPPPPPPVPTVADGFVIEAEKYDSYYDTSAGNYGSAACSSTDVDAEPTTDPKGGTCDVGWTDPNEWLQYNVTVAKDDEYDVTLRLASASADSFVHLQVDGVDVSGPVHGPGNGWQAWSDLVVPGVFLSAGTHSVVLFFDNGGMNVNYLAFARVNTTPPPPTCQMSCDDSNPCTTDSCDPSSGLCKFVNNTAACADDGNTCTNDVCAAGVCTHPANTATCADDGNTCTNDVCAGGVCTHPNNTGSCASDNNSCTNDVCSNGVCQHVNNTATCADDGSSCTSDVCSAGACTHPSNGTCTTATTPCSGLCTNPKIFSGGNYSSGNLGSTAVCYQTTGNLNGGVCGNLASGRKFTVNGVAMSCTSNWPNPLPAKRNGGYCIQATAGDYPWAYFSTW